MNDDREFTEGNDESKALPVPAGEGATGSDGGRDDDPERTGPPWEHRDTNGLLVSFARTLEESAFKPNEFFGRLRLTGNLLDALLFGIGIVVVAAVVQLLWSAVLAPIPFFLLGEINGVSFPEVAAMAAFSWLRVLVLPFTMVAVFFIMAGLFHLALTLLGSTPHPFETTLRVTCYSAGPLILSLVPFCGEWVGKIWMIVLLIIGLVHCQKASTTTAIVAVLFPLILFVGCCSLLIVIPIALSGL
ncbi:MAG: hypothetical protein HKN20_10815 [Gemmatimonadetes bacterium]|nr:hypothetical protein [Gemmatimonadota bacterium]